jgi:hypothetical protein
VHDGDAGGRRRAEGGELGLPAGLGGQPGAGRGQNGVVGVLLDATGRVPAVQPAAPQARASAEEITAEWTSTRAR